MFLKNCKDDHRSCSRCKIRKCLIMYKTGHVHFLLKKTAQEKSEKHIKQLLLNGCCVIVFYVFLCRSVCWLLYGPFCHGALTKIQFFSKCMLRHGVVRVLVICVLCVGFCTGHFVLVPLKLAYLQCLQLSFFEHLHV